MLWMNRWRKARMWEIQLFWTKHRAISHGSFGFSITCAFYFLGKDKGKIIRPTSSFGNYTKATQHDWKTILRIAAKWGFDQVRELAVRHLENTDIDLVNRIKLYKEHGVAQKHLFPLYMQLAVRRELITLDEAQILGMETLVKIHSVRERIRAPVIKEQPLHSPVRKDVNPKDITDIVASTFNIPIMNGQMLSPLTWWSRLIIFLGSSWSKLCITICALTG